MAIINLSSMFGDLYGRFGGFIFRRSPKGKTILSRIPNMKRVRWSNAQKAHRKLFKEAAAYAQTVLNDPEMLKHYQEVARQRNSKPYNLAISDYFAVIRKFGE